MEHAHAGEKVAWFRRAPRALVALAIVALVPLAWAVSGESLTPEGSTPNETNNVDQDAAQATSDRPSPAAPPRPGNSPRTDAVNSYMSLIDAWNSWDEAEYFGAFLPTLDCYYARAGFSREKIRAGARGRHFKKRTNLPLTLDALRVISADATEVVLREVGSLVGKSKTINHDRVIVMRKVEAGWKVALEVSKSKHPCYPKHLPLPRDYRAP